MSITSQMANLVNTKSPWGIYNASSWDGTNILKESRGNGRDVTLNGVSYASASGNGAFVNIPYLYGSTTNTMLWQTGSIPANFTICSITRYTGGANQRILQSNGPQVDSSNWLHGHWMNRRGVCYYVGWKTSSSVSNGTLTNWLVTCGKNNGTSPNNILVDGVSIGTANGGSGNLQLSINTGGYTEYSDWAFSNVIIWDQTLTDVELKLVSDYMTNYLSTGQTIYNNNTTCFKEGSRITCLKDGREQEVAIEELTTAQSYPIKTLQNGFLPIRAIGKSVIQNPSHPDRIKERLYKLSPPNYPEIYTPLYLTGCHGILVDSLSEEERKRCKEMFEDKVFVTDGKYRLFACLDERAEPWTQEGSFNIYHLALESSDPLVNYGIYANGLLVESCPIWSLLGKENTMEIVYKNI